MHTYVYMISLYCFCLYVHICLYDSALDCCREGATPARRGRCALSVNQSINQSIYLSIYLYLSLYIYIYIYIYMYAYIYIYMYLSLSLYIYIYIYIHTYVFIRITRARNRELSGAGSTANLPKWVLHASLEGQLLIELGTRLAGVESR